MKTIKKNVTCQGTLQPGSLEELVYKDLRPLLANCDPGTVHITLYVDVPSGGDYSGMLLEIDDAPLKYDARWTETDEVAE